MPTANQATSQHPTPPYFAGADVGASRTKVAVVSADGILAGYAVARSGTDFSATADRCQSVIEPTWRKWPYNAAFRVRRRWS